MLRMRRITQILAGAVVAAVGANAANATITVSVTQIPLAGTTFYGNVLNANGWTSFKITLTADAASQTVGGVDFATPNGVGSNLSGNNWGIFGTFQQDWIPGKKGSTPTPTDVIPASNPNDGYDSFWTSAMNSGFSPVDNPSEDNNSVNVASNPPYNGSPGADDAFDDVGVGTFLKVSGSFTAGQQAVLDVAYIIVPTNLPWSIHGVAADGTPQALKFPIDFSYPVPEPASLGVLALGGLAFLARRRKA